jgi:putative CocE/NonD family hydrolase
MQKWVTKSVVGLILLSMLIASLSAAAPGATTVTAATASQYEVITERNIMVPMRDGTKLAADICRPNAAGKFPTILVRTPYNKATPLQPYQEFFPQRGYVVVLQDVRGRFASEGVYFQNTDDGWGKNQDGYDTVEWVAKQPWSNGKVGATGISADGSSAALMMPTQPPHLVAEVIELTGGVTDSYKYRFYNGGVFRGMLIRWLLGGNASDIVKKGVSDPVLRDKVLAELKNLQTDPEAMRQAHLALPLNPTPIIGNLKLEPDGLQFWKDWLTHQTHNAYWDEISLSGQPPSLIKVPVLHVSGWFDYASQGTIDEYLKLQKNGGPGAIGKQRLIMGPWSHTPQVLTDKAGELSFPGGKMNGRWDYMLEFFDTYLKNIPANFKDKPPVQIYVMGDNVWRYEKEWPLPNTQYTNYYFRDGNGGFPITSLNGNKLLTTEPPTGAEAADGYAYNPVDPLWTLGGRPSGGMIAGPTDHRTVEMKSLTFTTPPLEKDMEVTGPVKAALYAMTSAKDTDWVVRLTDVYPDGRSMWVAENILRASYRDSMANPSPIGPNKVYKYNIDLWSTSQVFKKGHSIRVTVTSSDFPHYIRNLNTGKDNHTTTEMDVAYQTIFHDVKRPSHVVLPIIPRN